MSIYVIGDVHGCYNELKALLVLIKFNLFYDKIIFVGDLIGRGPNSIDVLELVMKLGDTSIHVLGNHDIKFMIMAQKMYRGPIPQELKPILESNRLDHYVSWLSASPLIYIDSVLQFVVTHAGLPPTWDILTDTKKYVDFFENYKRSNGFLKTMHVIDSGESLNWYDNMTDEEIIQYTIFGLTRLKFCFNDVRFDSQFQCAPGQQPRYLTPWFQMRSKKLNNNYRIIFGHWSALGLYNNDLITCCDSGCVWGNKLTALKVDSENTVYQVNSSFNASKIAHYILES